MFLLTDRKRFLIHDGAVRLVRAEAVTAVVAVGGSGGGFEW